MSILIQMASHGLPMASEPATANSPGATPVAWELQWSWIEPAWIGPVALAALALWIVVWYLRQPCMAGRGVQTVLIALRLATVGLVCLLLTRPTLERWQPGKPHLALLVDQSASMDLADTRPLGSPTDTTGSGRDNLPEAPPTRLGRAVHFLTAGHPSLIDRLQSFFVVDLVLLDDTFILLKPSEDLQATDQLRALLDRPPLSTMESLRKYADQGVEERHRPQTGQTTEYPRTNHRAATRLGDAVDYALRQLPGPRPAAIILLSDGLSTRGEPLSTAARRARDHGVPLYTVAVGEGRNAPEIQIAHLISEDAMLLGDLLPMDAIIQTRGVAGLPVEATLHDKGKEHPVARTSFRVPPDTPANQSDPIAMTEQKIRLFYQPTTGGRHDLELRIRLLSDGLQADARPFESPFREPRASHQVVVHDQPIRVLLAQSSPSYEYRALQVMLQQAPAIELQTRLQQADADFNQTDPTALRSFPLSQQELSNYDVVILGDIDPKRLPQAVWPSLLEFVSEQAGGLALVAGPRFLPDAFWGNRSMEVLMPIVPSGIGPFEADRHGIPNSGTGQVSRGDWFHNHEFSLQPAPFGQNDPSMQLADPPEASEARWRAMPPMTWLVGEGVSADEQQGPVQVKPGAHVLADAIRPSDGRTLPVIVRHFVGAGEVLMHLTDETWRLRFRSDDRAFARYWGQAVRRLARGRLTSAGAGVELATDASNYRPGETVYVQARFHSPTQAPAEDRLTLTMSASKGPNRKIAIQRRPGHRGLFAATLRGLRPDQYELRLPEPVERSGQQSATSATARFTILQPPGELARRTPDIHSLAEAAAITHGKMYTLSHLSHLPADLPAAHPIPLRQLSPVRLVSSHVVVGLLCGLLTAEWLLRRRCGML